MIFASVGTKKSRSLFVMGRRLVVMTYVPAAAAKNSKSAAGRTMLRPHCIEELAMKTLRQSPLYAMLFDPQALDVVRIIEGRE